MRLALVLLLSLFVMQISMAKAQDETEPEHKIILNPCRDNRLNVEFLCHPDWNIQSDAGVLLVIIAKKPYVTFTISKSDDPVMYLDELKLPLLQALGSYKEGFSVNEVGIDGKDALEVVAVSMDDPDTKMLDYYTIHKSRLYRFQFTVKPESSWSEAVNIITAIKQSVQFIN